MKKFLFAFAPFALVTVAVAGLEAARDETEHVSRTLKLKAGGAVHLKSFSGRVNIVGSDGDEVVVEAVRHASRDRLDHIKLDVQGDGSSVWIEANKRDSSWWLSHNNVVDTDFDIKVPRRASVDVKVFSAAVTISGVEGRHNVGGFSSTVSLVDVTGPIKAHTFSGPIEIRARNWQDDQEIDVDTFSGNVTLRVPVGAQGLVTFNSFSGHLNSDLPLTLREGGRRRLQAELGTGGAGHGSLRFKTFSGSVRIDR
jgi:DUF4097 and DUF4098 domain-containing protein YvlB